MKLNGCSSLPDDLVSKAIKSYKFNGASTTESMRIRQYYYAEKNGDFSVDVEHFENEIHCTLEFSDNSYTNVIPKTRDDQKISIYPKDPVMFENIRLFAISLRDGFSWNNEAFVAFYVGENVEESEEGHFNGEFIFTQYFIPRELKGDPTPNTVCKGEDPDNAEFMEQNIRNFVKVKEPNPWAYASLMVLYENEEIASSILDHEDVWDSDDYKLTPPNEVNPK